MGTGCARGFFAVLDTAWAMKSYASGRMTPLQVLAERESIYRLLGQTKPANTSKQLELYTINPATRYPNLVIQLVKPCQVVGLLDTDTDGQVDVSELPHHYLGKKYRSPQQPQQQHGTRKRRSSAILSSSSSPRIDAQYVGELLTWLRLIDSVESTTDENSEPNAPSKASFCQWSAHELAASPAALVGVLHAIIRRYRPELIDSALGWNDESSTNSGDRMRLVKEVCTREMGVVPVRVDVGAFTTSASDMDDMEEEKRASVAYLLGLLVALYELLLSEDAEALMESRKRSGDVDDEASMESLAAELLHRRADVSIKYVAIGRHKYRNLRFVKKFFLQIIK